MPNRFFHFEYPIYPLWRRRVPAWVKPLTEPLFASVFPVDVDRNPPETPRQMAQFLARWELLGDADINSIEKVLVEATPEVAHADLDADPIEHRRRVHITAQWEPMEKVLISWGIVYPPVWDMHAQMTEAITPVATMEILVPSEMWARAVWTYLAYRGNAKMDAVRFLILPTNDVWIRDYGPIIGLDATGERVAINVVYDPLPLYPQADDNAMVRRWSAHYGMPVHDLGLHTEGGNVWSDGLGTLIMSEQIFLSNRYLDRDMLERELSKVVDYEKLIITPRLRIEETGHVDMLVKLGSADTVFVSAPTSRTTSEELRMTANIFKRETNAAGRHYSVVTLPTPPLYFNWLAWNIRRSYTNAFTVNGRILVPLYGLDTDEEAIRIYEDTMRGYEIIPINARVGINGSGAVHCMLKEVPKAVGM